LTAAIAKLPALALIRTRRQTTHLRRGLSSKYGTNAALSNLAMRTYQGDLHKTRLAKPPNSGFDVILSIARDPTVSCCRRVATTLDCVCHRNAFVNLPQGLYGGLRRRNIDIGPAKAPTVAYLSFEVLQQTSGLVVT
jgi:hypothetical protein